MKIRVLETGVANIASVRAAFSRLGAEPEMVRKQEEIWEAELLVVPGVGTFGSSMRALEEQGAIGALKERISEGRLTVLICVGFQLLFRESEESPGVRGLSVIDQVVKRFPNTVSVPQMGWNQVVPGEGASLVAEGEAYYANSFRVESVPSEWNPSFSDYGGRFVAAVEREGVLACQFHPELSSQWGVSLLKRWIG